MVDSSQFLKMVMYAAAHVAQLFYYCFAGHALSYEVIKINHSLPQSLIHSFIYRVTNLLTPSMGATGIYSTIVIFVKLSF